MGPNLRPRSSSKSRYESMYRLHVGPKCGKRKVGSIKPSEIQEFLAELGKQYEASTPITALLVLQGIFDLAVADEKIKKNPAKADIVKAPSPHGRTPCRRRYLTTRQQGTHQLRHYFASVTLAGGVTIKDLSEY
ncbi:hypothetical protein [Nonomuraea sp. KM88]|uniref:hypothetical protein n=1 Tax=Nonomuraea sp. KM88 TaxID=3457427 RepID=UPI003FCC5C9D